MSIVLIMVAVRDFPLSESERNDRGADIPLDDDAMVGRTGAIRILAMRRGARFMEVPKGRWGQGTRLVLHTPGGPRPPCGIGTLHPFGRRGWTREGVGL